MAKQSLDWDTMARELAAFRKKFGHCRVLTSEKKYAQLGRWVAKQRYRHRIGELPSECVEQLNRLGFVWAPADEAWNRMFEKLVAFRARFGHCDVPSQWPEDVHLANWVASQRHRRKMRVLSAERIKRLDALQFEWAIYGRPKKQKPAEHKPKASEKAMAGETCERIYHVGVGTYVQYSGRGEKPALLRQYLTEHNGEHPPYIPLPGGPVVFKLGALIGSGVRNIRWPGKGKLPREVMAHVEEHGVLPPHD